MRLWQEQIPAPEEWFAFPDSCCATPVDLPDPVHQSLMAEFYRKTRSSPVRPVGMVQWRGTRRRRPDRGSKWLFPARWRYFSSMPEILKRSFYRLVVESIRIYARLAWDFKVLNAGS